MHASNSKLEPSAQPSKRPWQLAALFIFLGLLANEWLLGYLLANDGSIDGTKLLLLRLIQVLFIATGTVLLFSKVSFIRIYRDTAILLLNVLILLGALNLLAYASMRDKVEGVFWGSLELLWEDPTLMKRIYKTDSNIEIEGRIRSPGASGHPSLQMMMRPTSGKWYNSGLQGSRRSCKNGNPLEDQIKNKSGSPLNGAVWMFGGSTTYGTGVSDCETIVSALNDLDPTQRYFNFGVESRGQNPEIEHLLLLLRKGYRPSAVIFLDGLNDIMINALQTPGLPALESPAIPQQPYYFHILNSPNGQLQNMITQMPILQLLSRIQDTRVESAIIGECGTNDEDMYKDNSIYHKTPLTHYAQQQAFSNKIIQLSAKSIGPTTLSTCKQRIEELYQKNNRFLQSLSQAFNFEYRVFLQPLVALNKNNPFIKDPQRFSHSALQQLTSELLNHVARQIANKQLPNFIDISTLATDCQLCMVDANHYTKEFNQNIAKVILENGSGQKNHPVKNPELP